MLGDLKDNGRIMVEIRNRSYIRVLDSVVAAEKEEWGGSGGDGEDNEEGDFSIYRCYDHSKFFL
jgi:hypothetical protein